MECKYIIQLPGGGTLEVSASFGKIDPANEAILEAINGLKQLSEEGIAQFKKELWEKKGDIEETEEGADSPKTEVGIAVNKLAQDLKSLTSSAVSWQKTRAIIIKNLNTPDEIIPSLNAYIESLGNVENLESAVRNHVKKHRKKVDSIIKDLKKEIKPSYFKGIGTLNVVGRTDIKSELARIQNWINQNEGYKFSFNVEKQLKSFLNKAKKIINENEQTFLPMNNTINKYHVINVDQFTIYQENNNLSLFLGIFKRFAKNVDLEELKKVLRKASEVKALNLNLDTLDVDVFFNGQIKDGRFIEAKFHSLFNYTSLHPTITNIIKLVNNYMKETANEDALGEMMYLFKNIDYKTYGRDYFLDQKIKEETANKEFLAEKELRLNAMVNQLSRTTEHGLNSLYSQKETISTGLYANAKNNLILETDLVKFPVTWSENGVFAIVTEIHPVPNGVFIKGVHKERDGGIINLSHTFKQDKTDPTKPLDIIEYRKYEGPSQISKHVLEDTDVVLVDTPSGTDQGLIKKLVAPGSVVYTSNLGKLLVLGVLPGALVTKKMLENGTLGKSDIVLTDYSKITSFTSSIAYQDSLQLETIVAKDYEPIVSETKNVGHLLSEGDLFIDPESEKYKRVLYVDETNAYYLMPDKNGQHMIKSIAKKKVKSALTGVFGGFTAKEIKMVQKTNSSTSKRKMELSTFKNPDKATRGDYFIYTLADKTYVGKIIDAGLKKAIIMNPDKSISAGTYGNIENIKFFTKRSIESNYAFTISKINNFSIDLLKVDDPEVTRQTSDKVEMKYVIPYSLLIERDQDESKIDRLKESINIFDNKWGSLGMYVEAKWAEENKIFNKTNPSERYIDVTSTILTLLKEKGEDIEGKKLYATAKWVTKGGYNILERWTEKLYPHYNFSILKPEVKKALNLLQNGVYFSVYKGQSIDYNIYRVMSRDNGKIIAHLSVLNETGRYVTIEEEFDEDVLLALDGTDGSIAHLYLQPGNSNIGLLNNILNEDTTVADVKIARPNIKLRNAMIKIFRPLLDDMGIPIEVNRTQLLKDKKAAIRVTKAPQDESPKVKVVISTEFGGGADVIHEVLHLFLIPMRYKDPELYYKLLESLNQKTITETEDINRKEEIFVNKVSNRMMKNEDLVDYVGDEIDSETFIKLMFEAIKSINKDADLSGISISNPTDILNKPLHEVLKLDAKDKTHEMYNLGMIMTEPMIRKWMSEKEITYKCI